MTTVADKHRLAAQLTSFQRVPTVITLNDPDIQINCFQ